MRPQSRRSTALDGSTTCLIRSPGSRQTTVGRTLHRRIARQLILSARLKRLERDGLLVSRLCTERPPRAAYELTAGGLELAGALRLRADWGARHTLPGEAPRHQVCGTVIEARWYCPTCDRLVENEPETHTLL